MRSTFTRSLFVVAFVFGCGVTAAATPSMTHATRADVGSRADDDTANLLVVRNCKTDPTACAPVAPR